MKNKILMYLNGFMCLFMGMIFLISIYLMQVSEIYGWRAYAIIILSLISSIGFFLSACYYEECIERKR